MVRIAFPFIKNDIWSGGHNYLINLFTMISKYLKNKIKIVLFYGTDVDPIDLKPFQNIEGIDFVQTPLMNKSEKIFSLVKSYFLGRDQQILSLFKKNNIHLIFENANFFGKKIEIPVIAWIPDFQHKLLPKLFSKIAWIRREIGFKLQIKSGRFIMLSSLDSLNNCLKYYPTAKGKTNLVRFAISPRTIQDTKSVKYVKNLYSLPKYYFYLPNQFWEHKNHHLVLESLKILKNRGEKIVIVSSGKQYSLNKLSYFKNFKSKLINYNLEDSFILLGLIPYNHVISLMLGSLAVINPSLCEGRSTSVEEAILYDVPLILSDINIHIEQANKVKAIFFDKKDPVMLANILLKRWSTRNLSIKKNIISTSHYEKRIEIFSNDFLNLVKVALNQDVNKKYLYEIKNKKKISFIMMAYNTESYISNSIEALIKAGDLDWELIIIDDFSTDNTFKIAKKFADADSRIKLFKNLTKGKVSGTNYGFKLSTGQIIKCIDSDDVLDADYFKYFENFSDYDAHCHNAFVTDKELNVLATYNINPLFISKDYEFILKFLISYPKWSWSFSREIAKKIFPMPTNLPFEDVWIALMIKKFSKKIYVINHPLYFYRQHDKQTFGGIMNYKSDVVVFRSKRILKLIEVLKEQNVIINDGNKSIFNNMINYYETLSKDNISILEILNSNNSLASKIKIILIKKVPYIVKYLTILKWKLDGKSKFNL